MSYKKSKYNFNYKRNNDEYVLYNTYSKSIVSLNKSEYEQYQKGVIEESEIEQELVNNGFLLEQDFDEDGFLLYCHNMTKFSNEALHLVIAITMDCNFGCPYCYENRRGGKMSDEIQEAIIRFIQSKIKKGTKELDITWYGGEPLLYPDIIKKLGERIKEIANDGDCILNMYMVTNGYLLSEEIIDMLDSLGVAKIQITIDGLKDNHDLRRHLRDGGNTYERIMKNLELFDEYPIRVDIRMNVDNENCKDFIGLQKELESFDNSNIVLYPSPVEDINPDNVNEISEFMTYDEFEAFAGDICKEGHVETAATSVLDDRYCYCQAETENNYVIDELGNCYKCWDQAGRIETSCFNIMQPNDKNYSNIVKFLSWNPYEDKKCKTCVFLPICFGGCKFHRINTGKYDCGFTNESMKRYLEEAFFND